MSTEDMRFRHGREDALKDWRKIGKIPTRTLCTIRKGDAVYFGISRCNKNAGDYFTKEMGRKIAQGRAQLTKESSEAYDLSVNGVHFHKSLLRGVCEIKYIKSLLKTFDNFDEFSYGFWKENKKNS